MKEPLLIAPLFGRVLIASIAAAAVILLVIRLTSGPISRLDIGGTLISAVIAAFIIHLWIYYSRR